jgi:hypothetical protein
MCTAPPKGVAHRRDLVPMFQSLLLLVLMFVALVVTQSLFAGQPPLVDVAVLDESAGR